MFTTSETKIVVTTLTSRRTWLRKTLEDGKLEPATRTEYAATLTLLDAALKKLAQSAPDKSNAKTTSVATPRSNLTINTVRILVAEDHEESAELLMGMLEDFGVRNALLAKDGRDAFDKIKHSDEPFDIILCDWDMPELSGIQVHEKAKASNTLRGAHFCMVTGVSEANKIREAILQGINDYIVKPVDAQKLESKIRATIESKLT